MGNSTGASRAANKGRRQDFSRLCRHLSEYSPQPMVAVEGGTHIVRYVNPAFCRLIGKKRMELIGNRFTEIVPESKANGCSSLLDRVYQTGQSEILAEQEHTSSAYWSYSVWAIVDPGERPVGVMIQVTNATEIAIFRKQMTQMNQALMVSSVRQHELAETAEELNKYLQAASKAKDQFIAVLSHELRNPLTALRQGLQIYKQVGNNPVMTEKAWSIMDRQLNNMVRLVADLLDVSRITSGKLNLCKDQVELAVVVENAVETSRPIIDQMGHKLTVTLPSEPILLYADSLRLAQVFVNLLNNAAKYSQKGERILITAELQGDEVVVSVKDNGIGIPATHLPHIFDMFSQVDAHLDISQGGLGIGLSLVKLLVEMHGGRITAHSDGLGKGSEFVVRLPVLLQEMG